jgi:hypothetical protein
MRGKIFLILLTIIIITGFQPVFAQSGQTSDKPAAAEKTIQEKETVININLASDKDFIQALESAGDIELISEESAKTEKSDKNTNQGKPK